MKKSSLVIFEYVFVLLAKMMELMARLMPRNPGYDDVPISGNYMDPENQKKIADAIRFFKQT